MDQGEKVFLLTTATGTEDTWVLPKGHIEEEENPEFAAIRELIEETGILAMPIKVLGEQAFEKINEKVIVRYYLMRFVRQITTSYEKRTIQWLHKKDAINLLSFENAKEILQQA